MSHVTGRLKSPIQGALAGGGDPASSPLYVFGPALRLLVAAGVANLAFGTTLWLVVLTFVVVSAMYRRVMVWVTDGSGGSGLSGEEFGDWAVRLSAAITVIEYTLTFLVSMAALVTFIADRFPVLNRSTLLVENRTYLAVVLSIGTALLVNRGPRVTARAFGPATAGVLVLLWVMIAATVIRTGVHLPSFRVEAFGPDNISLTMGGYVRLLAAMTGVEVFANLVGAFDGAPAERSRKAFQGLLIVMVSTGAAMLIVGPAVQRYSDATNTEVSVFTQTMDRLLPSPLAKVGTLLGVAVLLSACAASAIGLQNLSVGMRLRHFVPSPIGRINRFGVADRPVWIEAGLATVCFLAFGTHEETYLALYAAGVFVLLALTGWAATKRLVRERAESGRGAVVSAGVAATLTTVATVTIFLERFSDGAWIYFVLVPALMAGFGWFRRQLGPPTPIAERIGASVGGGTVSTARERLDQVSSVVLPSRILVAIDETAESAKSLPVAEAIAQAGEIELRAITVKNSTRNTSGAAEATRGAAYGSGTVGHLPLEVIDQVGTVVATLVALNNDSPAELLVMRTHSRSILSRTAVGSVTAGVIRGATEPLLVVPPQLDGSVAPLVLRKILVPLDGTEEAEVVLPYLLAWAWLDSVEEVLLVHVPSGLTEETHSIRSYLEEISETLESTGSRRVVIVEGHDAALSIPALAREHECGLIMLATHRRGGLRRHVLGSLAEDLIKLSQAAVLLVPITASGAARPKRAGS